jgi:hypothetical protein
MEYRPMFSMKDATRWPPGRTARANARQNAANSSRSSVTLSATKFIEPSAYRPSGSAKASARVTRTRERAWASDGGSAGLRRRHRA